jgi:putative Mn2+ efflux pump MntP
MNILSIIILAIAVGMDALTISVARSANIKISLFEKIMTGVFYGGFHALMLVLGWIAGEQLKNIVSFDGSIVCFILILLIGLNMLYEGIKNKEEDYENDFSFKKMIPLAFLASIDAFVIGVSFSLMKMDIMIPVMIIGIIVFLMAEIGIILGKTVGHIFGSKFKIVGAVILILLAFNTLFQGLGISINSFF